MPLSEFPAPIGSDPNATPGEEQPFIRVAPPGPMSRNWAQRLACVECTAAFQPNNPPSSPIVYSSAMGSNVADVDGNRYVDMAAGFGAMLLGHNANRPVRALDFQAQRMWTGLGDVYPTEAKVAMVERVVSLYPKGRARALLCQSGSDAVTAAIKSAVLHTGRSGIVAFEGAYHGMGYAALSACGYRETFRAPFASQLNPAVHFAPYPHDETALDASLQAVQNYLKRGGIAAVLVEPLLGRGGCVDPPSRFLPALAELAKEAGALLIADEIWTGLGRTGAMLACTRVDVVPDIVCLGKGLGGGLPISACVGAEEVMNAWQRNPSVVHTSTFQGNPLACSTGVATIDMVRVKKLDERANRVGQAFQSWLHTSLESIPSVRKVTGAGFMVGVALESGAMGEAITRALLQKGYIVVTGGSDGQVLTLTPPLTIAEDLLEGFVDALAAVLRGIP